MIEFYYKSEICHLLMSVISNQSLNKKQPLWKVSVQTKNINKEYTVIHSTYQLPERFSPYKKGLNDSRLLNSSMDKLKLSRFQYKNERSVTPKPNMRASVQKNLQPIPTSSVIINNNTPKKEQKIPIVNLNNRESCFSLNSEHARNINTEGIRNFIHEHEANRKMILQVKEEFILFKKTVLQQMNLQRKMVLDFINKIQQTCNSGLTKQSNLQKQIFVTKKEVQSRAEEQVNSLLTFQNNIKNVQNEVKNNSPQKQIRTPDQKNKIKPNQFKSIQLKSNQFKLNQLSSNFLKSKQLQSNQLKSNQIKSNQLEPNKLETIELKSQQLKTQIWTEKYQRIIKQEVKEEFKEEVKEVLQRQPISEQRVKQSNIYQEISSPQRAKKTSPHLQKCTQIAETISILNQINASSVSTPKNTKSAEKQMIDDYKRKILAVTKSNDNLIKQKSRQSLIRTEEQNKVKGNFKLQKFYNAIQKLKEEVNQIKNINELKNSKILK